MTEGGTFIEVDGVESNLRAFADQIAIRESVRRFLAGYSVISYEL